MKVVVCVVALAFVALSSASHAQAPAGTPEAQPAAPSPADTPAATDTDGLKDLQTMTFACPAAALNAAAREAAKVPSQGTYQFSFFRIVSDSHHAAYEVHFKSNYEGEEVLKYCVAIYCQQGWDPKNSHTSVTLMGKSSQPANTAAHEARCGESPKEQTRRTKPAPQ